MSAAFAVATLSAAPVQPLVPGHRGTFLVVPVDQPEGGASLTLLRLRPRLRVRTGIAATGLHSIARISGGVAYTAGRGDGTVRAVDLHSGVTLRTFQFGAASEPQDIAVVNGSRAYVTLRNRAHLVRINPATGDTARSVDLSRFAGSDGNPDLSMMEIHEGRLFVQLQRLNGETPFGQERPALLAVIDLATEALVDADPVEPGIQAIALRGTFPKFRMQVVEETRSLFVSATGGFFDDGGIEVIDLDALASRGLAIREADGLTGADLGAFVMVTPETGYLIFSTDLLLSSHLQRFSLSTGVEPGPELHVTLDYFVPALPFDRATGRFFLPDGGISPGGIFVFDADSGRRLNERPIEVGGTPSDAALTP